MKRLSLKLNRAEQRSFSIRGCVKNASHTCWRLRSTVAPRQRRAPFKRPTLTAGMYALLAAFRGRSDNVQIYDVDLPTNSCGATVRAHGLRTGSDGFEPGAFIGFYTGRWGTRKSLGGANAYMLAVGDDENYVAPRGARCRRVDFGLHAMAAINEPSPGVCMPRPARRAARAHTRACAVLRWLQEVANDYLLGTTVVQ